jgi:hypothetical protein
MVPARVPVHPRQPAPTCLLEFEVHSLDPDILWRPPSRLLLSKYGRPVGAHLPSEVFSSNGWRSDIVGHAEGSLNRWTNLVCVCVCVCRKKRPWIALWSSRKFSRCTTEQKFVGRTSLGFPCVICWACRQRFCLQGRGEAAGSD